MDKQGEISVRKGKAQAGRGKLAGIAKKPFAGYSEPF
jgi:hypothetical protein